MQHKQEELEEGLKSRAAEGLGSRAAEGPWAEVEALVLTLSHRPQASEIQCSLL